MNTASATLTKSVATSLAASFAVLALGWCAMAPAQAQTSLSRIAWLSPERIYNESRLAKLASEKLQEEFKSREKAMQDMEARLKATSDKLEKDAPALSETERVKRQRDVFDLDKEYQRRQREFREDLSQRTNEERQAISDRATKIIRQMADTEGFDIVLQDAVWASKRIDITDKVLAALDKDK